MQQLNEAENTLLGITSGIIEVSVMQSTNYLKNASQQGLPFTLNPRVLYRGYVANCLNMGSVTGFQFFANGATKQLITGGVTRPLTPAEQIGAGFAAGSSSAILASPLELLMIQQQRKGGSMGGAAAAVLSAGPATVGRGLINTAMREGIYTAGYLGVGPAVREYIVQAVSDFGPSHRPPPASRLGQTRLLLPAARLLGGRGTSAGGDLGGHLRLLPLAPLRHVQDVYARGHRAATL